MKKTDIEYGVVQFGDISLQIVMSAGKLCKILFQVDESKAISNNATVVEACKQLHEYLSGKRQAFTIPVNPQGTIFQKEVWQALQAIPYGETRTYIEIASLVGRPTAYRAVGQANNRNPIPIVIPCHRVIGSDGSLTGYAGGLQFKKFLLELESDNPATQ